MSAGIERCGTGAFVAGGKARSRAADMARIARAVETPAFVIDERAIVAAARRGAELARDCGFRLLYALKPLPDALVLSLDGALARRLLRQLHLRGQAGPVGAGPVGLGRRDEPGASANATSTSWRRCATAWR